MHSSVAGASPPAASFVPSASAATYLRTCRLCCWAHGMAAVSHQELTSTPPRPQRALTPHDCPSPVCLGLKRVVVVSWVLDIISESYKQKPGRWTCRALPLQHWSLAVLQARVFASVPVALCPRGLPSCRCACRCWGRGTAAASRRSGSPTVPRCSKSCSASRCVHCEAR